MFLICGWCKKDMGEKEPLDNKDMTHGICKVCADALKKKYRMSDVLTTDDVVWMEKLMKS